MTNNKINVLVVDDSRIARMLLVHLLESDPQIHVIGAVEDGHAALDFLEGTKPDVVLMDIHMPGLDGFEATRRIMETQPVPIIICSYPHRAAHRARVSTRPRRMAESDHRPPHSCRFALD